MVKRQNENIPPGIGQGKRGEAGYLGYLLNQAAHVYRKRADRALSDLGITAPQYTVLTMLSAYPGCSGADLARLAMLSPQTISVIVANLEKSGALRRWPHPVHGRILTLELTESGRSLLTVARDRMRALERALTTGMTAKEEQAVRRWLVATAVAGDSEER